MSIASRIEQIEQHLTDDYSVLELAGADLTNVDKNIQNLKQSWEERLLYFLANGTDTLWNNWEKVSESGTEISLNNTIEAKMEFIYKGNTSQTGTPTPDTPIPVQVVSGDNTIKVEGANLVSSYRNATGTGQFWAALYVKANLKPNAFYEMSFIDNSTGNGYTRNENLAASVSSYSIISNGERQYYSFKTKDNISPDGNGEYLIFKNNKAQSQAPQFTNVDIREVAQLTTESFDYEPYVSQTYPINLGNIELCKIGDYQDRIYKDSGKWYLHKEIGKAVLDGDNKRVTYASGSNIYQFYYRVTSSITNFSQTKIYVFTNFFKGVSWSGNWTIDNSSALQNNGNLRLNTSKFDNANDFNLWLTTHNLIAYYVLATPTYEEITDTTLLSQLEAIKKSYNTKTNISQENNDLPFELDVVALGKLS